MQAIVPAAGLGTRMLPFSAVAAKELVPIGTRPAIQWTLEEAAANGIGVVAVVISPFKTALRSFLEGDIRPDYTDYEESGRWVELLGRVEVRIVEQPKPVGLGDALLRGRAALDGGVSYLMYPDNVVVEGEALFDALHRAYQSCGLSCVVCKADKPYFRGNNFLVAGEPAGETYYVKDATSKHGPKPEGLIWRAAGRAIVTGEFFSELKKHRSSKTGGELDDIDAYSPLAKAGRLLCLPPSTPIFDVGSPEGYTGAWGALSTGSLRYNQ